MKVLSCLMVVGLFVQNAFGTKVIGNWDVVPKQMFSDKFKIGVVAFHETGVDVEFKVNGTLLKRVTDPTYNDRTDVFEYWVELDAANYADGAITLDATAYPDGSGHTERVLPQLFFAANSGGSLTTGINIWADCVNGSDANGDGSELKPFKTLANAYNSVGSGNTVYLKRGTCYTAEGMNKTYGYWTTVTAAPGLSNIDVEITTGSNEIKINRLKMHNVSVYLPSGGPVRMLGRGTSIESWADQCTLYVKGKLHSQAQPGGRYLTNIKMGPFWTGGPGKIWRSVTLDRTVSDVFTIGSIGGDILIVNFTIYRADKDGYCSGCHTDLIQFSSTSMNYNVIMYNIRAFDFAQGIFSSMYRNVAYVNMLFESRIHDSKFSGSIDHMLAWNITSKQSFNITGQNNTNFFIQNNILKQFKERWTDWQPTSTASHNHHIETVSSTVTTDQNRTTGSAHFVDESKTYQYNDYRIKPSSPAYKTGIPLPGVPADIDGVLYDPVNPNRGCFAAANTGNPIVTGLSKQKFLQMPALSIYPNPMVDMAHFNIQTKTSPRDVSTFFRIYDNAGRVINTIETRYTASLQWNGTDQSGVEVQPGIYFYQIKDGEQSFSGKLMKIK